MTLKEDFQKYQTEKLNQAKKEFLSEGFALVESFSYDKLHFLSEVLEETDKLFEKYNKELPQLIKERSEAFKVLQEATKNKVSTKEALGNVIMLNAKLSSAFKDSLPPLFETTFFTQAKKNPQIPLKECGTIKEMKQMIEMTLQPTLTEAKGFVMFYGLSETVNAEALTEDICNLSYHQIMTISENMDEIPGFAILTEENKQKLLLGENKSFLNEVLDTRTIQKLQGYLRALESDLGPVQAKMPSIKRAVDSINGEINKIAAGQIKNPESTLIAAQSFTQAMSDFFGRQLKTLIDLPMLKETEAEGQQLKNTEQRENIEKAILNSLSVVKKRKEGFWQWLGAKAKLVKEVSLFDPQAFADDLLNLTYKELMDLGNKTAALPAAPPVTPEAAKEAVAAEPPATTAKTSTPGETPGQPNPSPVESPQGTQAPGQQKTKPKEITTRQARDAISKNLRLNPANAIKLAQFIDTLAKNPTG